MSCIYCKCRLSRFIRPFKVVLLRQGKHTHGRHLARELVRRWSLFLFKESSLFDIDFGKRNALIESLSVKADSPLRHGLVLSLFDRKAELL